MDPVGPWSAYTAYNRLAGVQAGAAGGDYHHHLAGGGATLTGHNPGAGLPSTTGQLLLQAAHSTVSLAGQLGSSTASPFNPGGFLSPSPVAYDTVFSPLFHHANPKPAHYSATINAQHRQALAQAQAAAASKQATVESELNTLRENYTSHHQSLAAAQGSTFFDQTAAPGSAAGLPWQGNNQLPSPFGILPHESVVPSSPSPATTKSSSSAAYENFNAHFAAAQSSLNNHLSSPLVANKSVRSASPQVTPPVKPVASQASAPAAGAFFQTPATFGNSTENISSYSTTNAKSGPISAQQEYTQSGSKSYSSTGTSSSSHLNQQSCIVTTPASVTPPGKEYRLPVAPSRPSAAVYTSSRPEKSRPSNFVPPPSKPTSVQQIQTKAQTKIYPELSTSNAEHRRNGDSLDNSQSQSSPISYTMDTPGRVNYPGSNSSSKAATRNIPTSQYPVAQQNSTYRHYQTGSNVDVEYHARNKTPNGSEINYTSSGPQSGPDCGVVVPRRPSPLQAHSQASPLGHVPSPAYPMYNSPMNSISSPQQHTETQNQISNYKAATHIAPRSPLDVTVSRSTSQNNLVAYSSVITRALGSEQSNKAYEGRYDHTSPQNQTQLQPQQNCWDGDRQQNQSSRKYPGNNSFNGSSSNAVDSGSRSEEISSQTVPLQQSQRPSVVSVNEKQTYYDSSQTGSQDLKSCRGDPMSIVKNLHTLQQNCQVQQEQQKQLSKDSGSPAPVAAKSSIRRKSSEKQMPHSNLNDLAGAAMAEYFTSRIPPPAHSSTTNQQQNGTYYDFERWNLPPPAKMFAAAAPFASQGSLHSSNFTNQHQGLMVPHPHSHASLPYFAPFHLPPHPADFQSTVEPITTYADSATTSTSSISASENRDGEPPKVVVPNIEEELGFLAEQRANSTAQTPPAASHQSPAPISSPQEAAVKIPEKKLTVPVTAVGSSFMASYLKFLQGERDKSPPPATRGGRKATWSRSNNTPANKSFNDQATSKAADQSNLQTQQTTNGSMSSSGSMNSGGSMNTPGVLSPVGNIGSPGSLSGVSVMSSPGAMLSPLAPSVKAIDHQDDPRYYSVPKDRKRKFDGTDDGYDPNDDEARRLNKPVLNVPSTPLNEKGKKGRAAMNKGTAVAAPPQATAASKKARPAAQPPLPAMQAQSHQQYYYQQPDEVSDPLMVPQRRETSHRKAKEKFNAIKLIYNQETGEIDDVEEPPEFVDSDADPAWTPLEKEDEADQIGVHTNKNKKLKRSRPVVAASRARNRGLSNILSAAAQGAGIDYADYSSEEESHAAKKLAQHTGSIIQQTISTVEEMPYQSGEFVAIKSELNEPWPGIWRVDGKTLLQKYEPFEQNGKVLYRNISMYATWSSGNKKLYIQVPTRVRAQNHLETIVELMRNEMSVDDDDFIEKRMHETSTYQDNFEVYIQTLISHALDPNFLTEIFQEQDEYFLTNVKTVDDITEERRRRIAGACVGWSRGLEAALGTWPCISSNDLIPTNAPLCTSCRISRGNFRLQLYGQPYNPATLEPCQPDPRIPYEKEMVMCRACAVRVELYSRISHQKYLMFIECNKRVNEKRIQDPHKDTTLILNELLADEPWLSQLFRDVRTSWLEAELMERKSRQGVTRQLM